MYKQIFRVSDKGTKPRKLIDFLGFRAKSSSSSMEHRGSFPFWSVTKRCSTAEFLHFSWKIILPLVIRKKTWTIDVLLLWSRTESIFLAYCFIVSRASCMSDIMAGLGNNYPVRLQLLVFGN